jgi:hypothetical protein
VKSLPADLLTLLASGEVGLATLVKLDFDSGTITLNTSNRTLSYGGDDYLGAAGLGTIEPITDSPGELPGLRLELQRVDSTYITLALDEADEVQGAEVTTYTAFVRLSDGVVVHTELDWTGYGDVMTIAEDGNTCTISMTAESKGVDLLRGNPLLYSDGDQKSLVPGDRVFEYVPSQEGQVVQWPTREALMK